MIFFLYFLFLKKNYQDFPTGKVLTTPLETKLFDDVQPEDQMTVNPICSRGMDSMHVPGDKVVHFDRKCKIYQC